MLGNVIENVQKGNEKANSLPNTQVMPLRNANPNCSSVNFPLNLSFFLCIRNWHFKHGMLRIRHTVQPEFTWQQQIKQCVLFLV